MLPDHQNALQNLTMKCYFSDCNSAPWEVKWTIDPPLLYEEDEDCSIPWFCIRFTSLGENHASKDPYHVTCSSDPSQNMTLSFEINRRPYFVNNTDGPLTLRVGERGTIDFGVVPGVPDVRDRYHYSKEDGEVSGTNGKISIEHVTRDNGTIYTLRLPDSYGTRSISVTVFEERQVVAAVRTSVEIAPFLDGNRTCLHWETGDAVMIHNSESYSISGTVLRINRVSSEDVGRVFTCVAEGNVKLKTRLLSKEHLSLCVQREENRRVIDHVINATVRERFCAGGKLCFSLSWSLEHKHVAQGVTHVYGAVNSSIEFVSKLNHLLGDDGIYRTHGLILSGGNCSEIDVSTDPTKTSTDPIVSSNSDEDEDDAAWKIYAAFGVSLVLSVTLGVVLGFGLCYLYRIRRHRSGRVSPDPENGNGAIPPQHVPQPPPYPANANEDQHQNPGLQNGLNPPSPELAPAASGGVSSSPAPTTPPVPAVPSTSSHHPTHPLTASLPHPSLPPTAQSAPRTSKH
jgi:hypothetical protein